MKNRTDSLMEAFKSLTQALGLSVDTRVSLHRTRAMQIRDLISTLISEKAKEQNEVLPNDRQIVLTWAEICHKSDIDRGFTTSIKPMRILRKILKQPEPEVVYWHDISLKILEELKIHSDHPEAVKTVLKKYTYGLIIKDD